jgi:hypothetical protein
MLLGKNEGLLIGSASERNKTLEFAVFRPKSKIMMVPVVVAMTG